MPADRPDLVVLSHLRWVFVWQRPQHVVSRLAAMRAADGARTWFVEEPVTGDVAAPVLRTEDVGSGVTRVWLVVPRSDAPVEFLSFGAPGSEGYAALLADLLDRKGRPPAADVWLYTPLALDIAESLQPGRLVYDVMDDLASFARAPEGLRLRQRRTLAEADIVFTGGRSLHAGVARLRAAGCHLFRSGVETAHYERSRLLRQPHAVPVAGYVGVVDERMDLDLLAAFAAAVPDWIVRIVGPVVKIDPATLPRSPNLEYAGIVDYDDLPEVMAGFDVALMPFALSEATRSLSPTKTLEYLAAGLPVVSTRIPDVVADFGTAVHLADTGAEFADACRHVLTHSREARDRRVRPLQAEHEWDAIAGRMDALLEALPGREAGPMPAQAWL